MLAIKFVKANNTLEHSVTALEKLLACLLISLNRDRLTDDVGQIYRRFRHDRDMGLFYSHFSQVGQIGEDVHINCCQLVVAQISE